MDSNWQVSNKRVVLQSGKFLKVEYHTITLPDGTVIPDWSWVITPDFINVVLVDADGQFVLFKQSKYAYEGIGLAPVGGYIEPDEDPLEAAKREVLEETGYTAKNWHSLGSYIVDANRGVATAYTFLATGAEKIADPDADDLEAQELVLLAHDSVQKALFNNEFPVLPWANLVALSLLKLQELSE